jgi:hypothetical protein
MEPKILLRLQFLVRVVRKECKHLNITDQRLFGGLFTLEQATRLEEDPDLAERVEAFVGRFGRLQDTMGDKLLQLLLTALGEKPSAAIDNLDRAERLGLIKSADEWMTMRNLRNQMVHEYIEDPRYTQQRPANWSCFCAYTHNSRQQNDCRNHSAGLGVMQNAIKRERPNGCLRIVNPFV